MTEPSQYFKGRTVQEQMDEVIGYVDKRAEEVAAAKANSVLQPAEDAKTAAQAAAVAAEAAKDTTLAALPEIRQDISGLKAEDTALDGRLDNVELKVQTAEGNIVTIQGQIVALQTADGQNVKIAGAHAIGNYAMLLTDNQNYDGIKRAIKTIVKKANIEGAVLPDNYWIDNHLIEVQGNNDNVPIISIGSERRNTGWETRINLNIFGSIDNATQRQNNARIIFIFDEIGKKIVMQVAHYDAASNNTTYNDQQTLLSW